ncbi:MAG: replicative DNA helicase [Bacteroidales bacterium]|nr:replicative DNA helicase [Bacteroidales bacterium]MBR4115993.1 replicative DNA helicase [Bacteroidales bacterium]MBR6265250.1 replicative DNA helicase [Bacteroidales bacterium]
MAKKNFQREVELKIDYGNRVAPHSETLEDTVLGQILINSEAISDVMNFLHKEVFFMPQNQIIFEAMENLAKENLPITLVTVIERLNATEKLNEVGGPSHITNLSMKVTSSANIEHHAKILIQKYIQRELIRVSAEITEKAFDPACELTELTDEAEKKILEVTDQNMQKKPIVPIEKITSTVFEQFVEASKHKTDFTGVPSGFTKLDKLTAGWQPGSMIVLAARPGMGKTAFVLTMLRNMAVDYDIPVGMFSLEMSCEQLATRLFVGEAEIEQIKLQTGNIRESDIGKLQSAQEKLSAAKIFLDDTPGLPIYEFKSKCRRMVEMNHVKCIVVDYLQLMTAPGYGSREQEVSNISRQIKATAMELKIPIIALAQLNRGVEGRIGTKEKKPRLSDLRESGAIEQDADLVMFIHRDAKALGTNEIEGRDISKDADIIVAKNRHGASDDIKLQFIGQYMKFKEPENDNFVPLEQINNTSDPTILDSSLNSLENEQFAMDKSSEMPF